MNKLIVFMVALCNIISLIAMEERTLIPINKKENDFFALTMQSSAACSNKAVTDGKISLNNMLHIIINDFAHILKKADNNLSTVINDYGLDDRLEEFKKFEFDEEIIRIKNDFYSYSDNAEIKNLLFLRRQFLAELDLAVKQPTYVNIIFIDNQNGTRIDYFNGNENYPVDVAAVKDYIVAFIYETILAHRITIYDSKYNEIEQ